MRKVAVTTHAVERFRQRVQGAQGFEDESIRSIVRGLVESGFAEGLVRPHPYEKERRIIPFQSGKSVLYLSVGPNTTFFQADLAVISVLYERDLSPGKVELGVFLGDVSPVLQEAKAVEPAPEFLLVMLLQGWTETYPAKDKKALDELIERRRPEKGSYLIYKLAEG